MYLLRLGSLTAAPDSTGRPWFPGHPGHDPFLAAETESTSPASILQLGSSGIERTRYAVLYTGDLPIAAIDLPFHGRDM